MKYLVTILATAIIASSTCLANEVHFDAGAGAGDRNWNTAVNWSDDTVPTATTTTDVKALDVAGAVGYGVEVNNPGAVANSVDVGAWGHPGKMTVNSGGTLTIAENLFIAQDVGFTGVATNNGLITVTASVYMKAGIGTFVNNGTLTSAGMILGELATSTSTVENTGTMNINGWLYLSLAGQASVFNMNGGNLNTSNIEMPVGGIGHLNLNGGVITNATIGLNGDGNYTIEVDNGIMYSLGDHTGGMQYMIDSNFITAKDSKTPVCSFDGTYTVLSAVPEPAIIGLVSLLGFALFRRK